MGWVAKLVVELVKAFIASFTNRLRRDREKKQEGRQEVIDDAHREADARKAAAQELEDNYNRLSPDARERLRIDKNIYRD